MSPTIAVGAIGALALASSVALNAWQYRQNGQLHEDKAVCEGNMQSLIEAGDEALARSEKERDAAKKAAAESRGRARAIIDAPQAVPGDACGSADKEMTEWLRNRR